MVAVTEKEQKMSVASIAGAVATGIIWVVALSLAEGLRAGVTREGAEGGVYAGIVLAVIVSVVGFALVTRAKPIFGFVLAATMLVCALVGLLIYPLQIAAVAPADVLDLSTVLTRAGSSLAVWGIACGVAVLGISRNFNHLRSRRTR